MAGEVDMVHEAERNIEDVSFAVLYAGMASKMGNSALVAHINVTTKEEKQFCIKVTESGFQVIGNAHGTSSVEVTATAPFYETLHTLLDTLSPAYTEAFGNTLCAKLTALKENIDS